MKTGIFLLRPLKRMCNIMSNRCEWGYGMCTAPDTDCQFWHGTFCEIDNFWEEVHCNNNYNDYCNNQK